MSETAIHRQLLPYGRVEIQIPVGMLARLEALTVPAKRRVFRRALAKAGGAARDRWRALLQGQWMRRTGALSLRRFKVRTYVSRDMMRFGFVTGPERGVKKRVPGFTVRKYIAKRRGGRAGRKRGTKADYGIAVPTKYFHLIDKGTRPRRSRGPSTSRLSPRGAVRGIGSIYQMDAWVRTRGKQVLLDAFRRMLEREFLRPRRGK